MFRKLLVPLDRFSFAEQALGQAIAIARASNAELDLALVHQPFPLGGFDDAPWSAALWNDEREYLESVAAGATSGSSVPVTHALLRGEPVQMICQRIRDVHADLVVMTSHGRTGLSRAWLGSVADGVLRHSTVPVLVLRPIEGATRRAAAHHLFKHVLVPVDESVFSTEVLPTATSLARCSNARMTLLRVVQPVPLVTLELDGTYTYSPRLVDNPATAQLAGEAEARLAEIARRVHEESGLEVAAQVVVESRIAQAIADFANAHAIDAIAMSTHGRGASRFLLGSVADKVLRASELPLLLYRPVAVRARTDTTEAQTSVTHT
jgi:nucleotide-binding universal stress UspA family protein